MELIIYGISSEELDSRKFGEKQGEYLGEYDGIRLKSDKYEIEQLEEFDYLHIFTNGRVKQHSPKRFNNNIEKKLKSIYIREFGECIQTSLL